MRIKLLNLLYYIKSSFWFMPSIMVVCAICLSRFTLVIDNGYLKNEARHWWWVYNGSYDGALTILSTITSSMITVAGVVFSITIVVLSQASAQFGPRLIRNFMNIRTNQMVLGLFVSTYMFGMLVLNAIKRSSDNSFYGNFSVTTAIALSFLSLAVMIYFIHNISESIQAQNIIARVHKDLEAAIDRIFPQNKDKETFPEPDRRIIERFKNIKPGDTGIYEVLSNRSGYFQVIDMDELLSVAAQKDIFIHLGFRPGNFITKGSVLVCIKADEEPDKKLITQINKLFITGNERTLEQDVEYAVSQMVEIAVRALSPGINDPVTAMTCLDWLGDALTKIACRSTPKAIYYDDNDNLRVIRKVSTFCAMVDEAFNMIRQNAGPVPAVSIRILEVIATVGAKTERKEDRKALLNQASMVVNGCSEMIAVEHDRKDLESRYRLVLEALNEV